MSVTGEEHRDIIERLAGLEGQMESIKTLLQENTGRVRDEVRVLFATQRELDERIRKIEISYVPKSEASDTTKRMEAVVSQIRADAMAECKRIETANIDEHRSMVAAVADVGAKMNRVLAYGTVIWAVIGIGLQVAMRWLGH